jgi:dipeptidyl aminopeptidase/acylaminoacyl peptidase
MSTNRFPRAGVFGLLGALLLAACASGSPAASTPASSAISSAPASEAPSFTPPDLEGRLLFTRSGGTFGDDTVFTANANGTDEHQLGDLGASCCPWATRDGMRVSLSAQTPDGRITTAIANVDGSAGSLVPLPNGTLNLGPGPFSPDGRQIAFEGFDDAHPEVAGIYIGNTDGTNLVRISTERDSPGDWSPDGTQVVFFRGPEGDPPPSGSLFVVNVDGSDEHQLTPPGVEVACCWNYRWSPDGSRILFADAAGVLWVINPDGTHPTQLFVDASVYHNRRYAVTPTWSPDARNVIFALDASPPFSFRVTANGLYVNDGDGTGLTLVIGGNNYKREPYWIP